MSDLPLDPSWKAIHHELVPLMRPGNRTNIAYLIREYVLLGLILTICGVAHARWSGGNMPIWAYGPIAAVGVFAVGAIQHRFRAIGTDGPSVLDVLAREPEPGDLIWDGPPRRYSTVGAAEPIAVAPHS